ncbi:MAG: LCP family protein [Propionibacteriaceae bacterium]|nr:LCP family protein [Propionibacteriaceae bacterium]
MSDDAPRRGYGLGDEPHFDDAPNEVEDTSTFTFPSDDEWFRPAARPTSVPQRALRARDEWADVPWGQQARRLDEPARPSSPTAPQPSPTRDPFEPQPPNASEPFEPRQPKAQTHARSAKKTAGTKEATRRQKLRTSLLLTAASTVLPGSGLLGAPQRWLKITGAVTSVLALALGAFFLTWALGDTAGFASVTVDPSFLTRTSFALIGLGLLWVALIATTHIATRPGGLVHGKRLLGAVVVTALAFGVSAPSALGARYSRDQVMLVEKVFGPITADEEVVSSTRPTLAADPKEDPWKDIPRVNILLLGADGNEARADAVAEFGIRTDTIIAASIDTTTGDTLLVQVPRNVRFTPFKEGSELHDIWPRGQRGEEESDAWINGLWRKIEMDYPDVLRGQTYRGAEALKQGVESITGLEADYFMMLDIDGLERLITAMGGVRVNINEPLPMGRAKNCRDPEKCLMPGPNQRLNGYEAMWYARSRVTTSDYSRMARQSCLIDAVIKQANPATMLTSYEGIASAASHMITTDIPQRDLKAFVELAFKVKDAKIQRLVFTPGKNGYSYENPDFEAMRQAVEDAINPPAPDPVVTPTDTPSSEPTTASPSPSPSASATPAELVEGAQTVADACAWHGGDEEG